MENKEKKEYKEERFNFALYVNDNLICMRNFKINRMIQDSMDSIDFKHHCDDIVQMIDEDLKSKTRVSTWFYHNSDLEQEMLLEPLEEPWAVTFRFEVTDNGNIKYCRCWDGRYYTKNVREKVDISNRFVKFTTRDGRTFTYNKKEYFDSNPNLSPELYLLKAMINDKEDLLFAITKKICEVCSPRDDGYQTSTDYTFAEKYCTRNPLLNDDGTVKRDKKGNIKFGKQSNAIKYSYNLSRANNDLFAEWGKAVSQKTKDYLKTLY